MSKYLDRFKKESLVAALGFNDGANKGFWRVQWRDLKGRFAEMGRGVLSKVRMPNGEVMDMRGVFIGGTDRPGFGRVLVKGQSDKGIPDGVYEIGSNNGEIFQAKLTDETLERAGIEDTDVTTASERLDSDIPNLEDIVRKDITPEDEKLATDVPDEAQKAIIEEERAKSPIAKLPAGSEGRDPESAKKILEDAGVDLAEKAGIAPAKQGPTQEGLDEMEKNAQKLTKDSSGGLLGKLKNFFSSAEKSKMDTPDLQFYTEIEGARYPVGNGKPDIVVPGQKIGEFHYVDEAGKPAMVRVVRNDDGSMEMEIFSESEGQKKGRGVDVKFNRETNKWGIYNNGDKAPVAEFETSEEASDALISTVTEQLGFDSDTDFSFSKGRTALRKRNQNPNTKNKKNPVNLKPSEEYDSLLESNGDASELGSELLAVRKAFDDATLGNPVNLDDAIDYAREGAPSGDIQPMSPPKLAPEGTKLTFPDELKAGDIVVQEKDGVRSEATVLEAGNAPVGADGLKRYYAILKTPTGTKKFPLRGTDSVYVDKVRKDKASVDEYKSGSPAPKSPETPVPPKAPKAPETPKQPKDVGPTFIPKDRPDNGQDIALPDVDENTLWAKKVAPLRDENGNKVRAVDPETGDYKSTFAEDPDAVLSAIFENFPDAVVLDDGGILVERTSFTDSDGVERQLESIIRRTKGSNYMVGYRITEPDGTQEEYFSHDYRDSFSSIFGKRNGLMRLSAIIKGEVSPLKDKDSDEYKFYFGTGLLEDRLKYFRGKTKSKATDASLVKALAIAEADGNEYEIGLAKYNLNLLREDFKGDVNAYRRNAEIQLMRLITLEETVDRYATGRFYRLNNASGKSNGTVLRSAVDGVYGGIEAREVDGVVAALDELAGRLPDLVKNPNIAQLVLDRLRAGIKDRFSKGNRQGVSIMLTNGYKAWTKEGYSSDELESAPHVSWGRGVIDRDMLVEYTNNNNQTSRGVVHSVIPNNKNPDPKSPNQYFDYVKVSFKGEDGKMQPPVTLAAKNMKIIDESGLSEESLDQVTIYTPGLKGEERLRVRYGDAYYTRQKSRYTDMFPGATDDISSGFSPRVVDPAQYEVDILAPGGYLYDSNGLPVGQIAGVRNTTSASGEKGYTFAHVDPKGNVGFTSVKAGTTRAPKQDISKEDGRGSDASDEGFTPNPADFRDAGFDVEGIGSEFSDADQTLLDLVESSDYYDSMEAIPALASLAKVTKAKYDYENSDSEESKATYKDIYKKALTNYYTGLAKYKAVSAKFTGTAYAPGSIPSDSILEATDVANINARIAATYKPFEASGNRSSKVNPTYEDVVEAYSGAEEVYSGYLPQGWANSSPAEGLDRDATSQKSIFAGMMATFLDGKGQIPEALIDVISKRSVVDGYTNSQGEINPVKFHALSSPSGDLIQVHKSAKGEGYITSDADLDTSASVMENLRNKLNLGDAPLTHVFIDSSRELGSSGTLGYVYSREMFSPNENFAKFHSVVDKINKFIAEYGVSPREDFVQGKSWFAVDISDNPESIRRYVTSHELGHVMQGKILRNLGAAGNQKEWDRLYGPVARSYRISQYGASNYNEHFAESFARWELTGQADPKFLEFLDKANLLTDK